MRQISGILLNPSFLALVILFGLLFLQAAFYFLGLPWSRPVTLAFYLTSAMWALGCAWAVRRTWLGFNKIDAFFVAFVCFLALSLGASNLTSEVDQRLWGFLLLMVVVPYVCGRSLSSTLLNWAAKRGIHIAYIQPGKPQQNAYVERYNRTVRYDWLGQYLFDSMTEVQDFATRWLWTYNHERPNMALGGFTPKQWLAMTT